MKSLTCSECGITTECFKGSLCLTCYDRLLGNAILGPLTLDEVLTSKTLTYRGQTIAAAFVIGWPLRTVDQAIKDGRLTR